MKHEHEQPEETMRNGKIRKHNNEQLEMRTEKWKLTKNVKTLKRQRGTWNMKHMFKQIANEENMKHETRKWKTKMKHDTLEHNETENEKWEMRKEPININKNRIKMQNPTWNMNIALITNEENEKWNTTNETQHETWNIEK